MLLSSKKLFRSKKISKYNYNYILFKVLSKDKPALSIHFGQEALKEKFDFQLDSEVNSKIKNLYITNKKLSMAWLETLNVPGLIKFSKFNSVTNTEKWMHEGYKNLN